MWIYQSQHGNKHGISFVLGIGVKRKHKELSSYPSLAMSSLWRQREMRIYVDGREDQRREVAGEEKTI